MLSVLTCMEPLYKGQVVQWNLSTRDKLLYSGTSLQGTSCIVEPLYKGQVEGYQVTINVLITVNNLSFVQRLSSIQSVHILYLE